MYPIPPGEHLVETRKCRQCSGEFPITDKDMEFYSKVSPSFPSGGVPTSGGGVDAPVSPLWKEGGSLEGNGSETGDFDSETGEQNPPPRTSAPPLQRRFTIPPPTLCPDCRQQRRLAFRNERKLYKRKCDATGKDIISIYSPDKPYTVYHQDYWWSDAWDPMSYGREFDFSRSAMEQFQSLSSVTPKNATFVDVTTSVNSIYSNHVANLKNCYFTFTGYDCEGCLYTDYTNHSQDCVDCTFSTNINQCYSCTDVHESFKCSYCMDCTFSNNLYFCSTCEGCSYCFLCTNLSNKKYCIENVEYSESEYKEKLKKQFPLIIINPENTIARLRVTLICQESRILNSEACLGHNIINSNNCHYCFDIKEDSENLRYCSNGGLAKDVYDSYGFGANQNLSYETSDAGLNCSNQYFSATVHAVNNVFYSQTCYNSSHLFLCTGLRNKSYCILNRQYTKEEYEVLVPKIIEHMSSPQPSPEGEGVNPLNSSSLRGAEERGGVDALRKDGRTCEKSGITSNTWETKILRPSDTSFAKEAYEWGEFFPASMSPFGYNETVANEYFPMTREEVLGSSPLIKGDVTEGQGDLVSEKLQNQNPPNPLYQGGMSNETFLHGPTFNWSDYEPPFPKVEKVIPASKLPDDITKIPDDILNWAIECEISGKPFRIIKQELEFYRKHNLPIPRRHPDVRHMDRMKMRNPRKLFERLCDCQNCEENWKMKGVVLKEGVDSEFPLDKEPILSLSNEGEGDLVSEQNPPVSSVDIPPSKGGLRKKMITTYAPCEMKGSSAPLRSNGNPLGGEVPLGCAPERPERVYCEECYLREVAS